MDQKPLELIENDLSFRINLEASRKMDPDHLASSRDFLQEISQREIFSPQGIRINVVGSNGKGSTSYYLSSLASQHCQTGLYLSPHLISVLERICIGNQEVNASLAWTAMCAIQEDIGEDSYKRLSYFEILTLLALFLFKKKKCQIQIYEAGLGGRLDATRISSPQVIILTPIEKDHVEILGSDPKSILKEKLGMIQKNTLFLFCMKQKNLNQEDVKETASSLALSCGNPSLQTIFLESKDTSSNQTYLEENYSFAESVLEYLSSHYELGYLSHSLPADHLPDHLSDHLRGRLEIWNFSQLQQKDKKQEKEICFDTAHNPSAIFRTLNDMILLYERKDGLKKFCEEFRIEFRKETAIFLALLKDRSADECVEAIYSQGFTHIFQMIGEQWAEESPAVGQVELFPVAEDQAVCTLIQNLQEGAYQRIIFLGTHRSYRYFIEMKELLHKGTHSPDEHR